MFFERVDYTKIQELSKKMKSFFCQGRTINTTSYMNWRISKDDGMSFWSLAEGYFETADALISKCLEDNSDKKADIFIFPILFNVVHAVELSLKAINDYLNIILYDKAKIEGGHDIKQLSDVTLKLLQKFKANDKGLRGRKDRPYNYEIGQPIRKEHARLRTDCKKIESGRYRNHIRERKP